MRFIVASFSASVLLACSTTPAARNLPQVPDVPLNSTVEFLLTSAATDISHMQSLARPVRFREVRSGYVMSSATEKQYMLCGSFSPAQETGAARWIPFVTIKTSGYEQYLGAQAVGFCTRPSVTWDKGDLSPALQSRFDSTQ